MSTVWKVFTFGIGLTCFMPQSKWMRGLILHIQSTCGTKFGPEKSSEHGHLFEDMKLVPTHINLYVAAVSLFESSSVQLRSTEGLEEPEGANYC